MRIFSLRLADALHLALWILLLCGVDAHCADDLDLSALPTEVLVKQVRSVAEAGLIHETSTFWEGDRPILSRDLWLTSDRREMVRVVHTLMDVTLPPRGPGEACRPQTPICVVYHFKRPIATHSVLTHHIPAGCRLLTTDADEVSPSELRLSRGQQVLASIKMDADGLMVPRTRAEFEVELRKRQERLGAK
jgi:hypothetical protein